MTGRQPRRGISPISEINKRALHRSEYIVSASGVASRRRRSVRGVASKDECGRAGAHLGATGGAAAWETAGEESPGFFASSRRAAGEWATARLPKLHSSQLAFVTNIRDIVDVGASLSLARSRMRSLLNQDTSTPRLLKTVAAVMAPAIPLAARVWRQASNETPNIIFLDGGRAVL